MAAIEDVRASATLTELAQALSGTPRLSEGAGPALWSYDAEHGTAYASTLLAYLDANSDIAAAARRLNVHPEHVPLPARARRADLWHRPEQSRRAASALASAAGCESELGLSVR